MPCCSAEVLGEALGSFEPRGSRARPERLDAGGFQIVHNAGARAALPARPRRDRRRSRGKTRSARRGPETSRATHSASGRCRHCRGRRTAGRSAGSPRSSRPAHARVRPSREAECSWAPICCCGPCSTRGRPFKVIARSCPSLLTRVPLRSTTTVMNEPRLNLPELTVSELSAALKRTIEDSYGYVRVRGETRQSQLSRQRPLSISI